MAFPVRSAVLGLAAAITLGLVTPALADTVYECQIEQLAKNRGWLPSVVALVLKDGASEATVNDPILNEFVGKPVQAKVDTDNTKRTTLSWNFTTSGDYRYVKPFNRLTITKSDLSASMSGSLGRYSN